MGVLQRRKREPGEALDTVLDSAVSVVEGDPSRLKPPGGYAFKAKQADFEAKQAARKNLKPMPDPEAGKAMRRKEAARKRKTRGGRASTILSEGKDTLG